MQYKDKARQKQRNQNLKQLALKSQAGVKPTSKHSPAKAQQAQQPSKKLPAAKRRLIETREDDADLTLEYRYLKKLRQGKITEVRSCTATLLAALHSTFSQKSYRHQFLYTAIISCIQLKKHPFLKSDLLYHNLSQET